MSNWSRIRGMLTVYSVGATEAQQQYVLQTVLDHLPRPFEEEIEDIAFQTFYQPSKYSDYTLFDEFGNPSNLGKSVSYDEDIHEFHSPGFYTLAVRGDLRWYDFGDALRHFMRWLCRLAKRIDISDCFIHVWDDWGTGKYDLCCGSCSVLADMFDRDNRWTDRLRPAHWVRDK